MTTGRPRLESTVSGLLILGAVRLILTEQPDASPSTVAFELRRRGIPRLSGNLNWNDRAARTAMDRLGEFLLSRRATGSSAPNLRLVADELTLDSRPAPR